MSTRRTRTTAGADAGGTTPGPPWPCSGASRGRKEIYQFLFYTTDLFFFFWTGKKNRVRFFDGESASMRIRARTSDARRKNARRRFVNGRISSGGRNFFGVFLEVGGKFPPTLWRPFRQSRLILLHSGPRARP
jgi:hypothetical protein